MIGVYIVRVVVILKWVFLSLNSFYCRLFKLFNSLDLSSGVPLMSLTTILSRLILVLTLND
jgi:hypothetical protein